MDSSLYSQITGLTTLIRAAKLYRERKLAGMTEEEKAAYLESLKPKEIELRKKDQGRNEKCNCGSGKKYKNCCGQ